MLWSAVNNEDVSGAVKMNGQRDALRRMVVVFLRPPGPTGGCGCAPRVVTPTPAQSGGLAAPNIRLVMSMGAGRWGA